MGKISGFKEYNREVARERKVAERVRDFKEVYEEFPLENLRRQAARCMDCGVPFCHSGCPLGNLIPDWNDYAYRDNWPEALKLLLSTNNFPEFTGRVCPAPCEEACVLGINNLPVTIEQIEKRIIEEGFGRGLMRPRPPERRSGKKVAVVGSGPAGLAAAQQLNRAGHAVVVFERAQKAGGLLRYGIPDFKLEKWVLDRRLELLEKEGIVFRTGTPIGNNRDTSAIKGFDAVVLCCGSTQGRDLPLPGRDLQGIHFAMEYLPGQNRLISGEGQTLPINAKDKHVIVVGGGDTGSDCIGTARRQGARSVTNFELMPLPPAERPARQPWPYWPMRLRLSSSHHEGCERFFSIMTKEFIGVEGRVRWLKTVNIEFVQPADGGRQQVREIAGTEYRWPADLVFLALGFSGPERDNVLAALNVKIDKLGNIETDGNYQTSVPGVFAAGDARRGQSLVVWAISEGREAARAVDTYLMGRSDLPTKGRGDLPRV